jgi:hypothetical protein
LGTKEKGLKRKEFNRTIELRFKHVVITLSSLILIISFFLPWTYASWDDLFRSGFEFYDGCSPGDMLYVKYEYVILVLISSIVALPLTLFRTVITRISSIICLSISLSVMIYWWLDLSSLPNIYTLLNISFGFIIGIISGGIGIVLSAYDSLQIKKENAGIRVPNASRSEHKG